MSKRRKKIDLSEVTKPAREAITDELTAIGATGDADVVLFLASQVNLAIASAKMLYNVGEALLETPDAKPATKDFDPLVRLRESRNAIAKACRVLGLGPGALRRIVERLAGNPAIVSMALDVKFER